MEPSDEDAKFGARGFGRLSLGIFSIGGGATFHYGPLLAWPAGSEKVRAGRMLPEISGREAADLGLITRAVPAEELDAAVERYARAICLLPQDAVTIAKETMVGIQDIIGLGNAIRNHYTGHTVLQFVHFRPEETNLYKVRRNEGLKGFIKSREARATPGQEA